jgi:hypothetical protein
VDGIVDEGEARGVRVAAAAVVVFVADFDEGEGVGEDAAVVRAEGAVGGCWGAQQILRFYQHRPRPEWSLE